MTELAAGDAAAADDFSAWDGHGKGTPGYRRLVVALTAAGVATFAQLYSLQGVLPAISRDFQVDAPTAALSISAATTGLALSVLAWSAVADRIGRVRSMKIALVATIVIGLLMTLSPNIGVLLGLRLLEGAALGGVPALAITYLNEEVSRKSAVIVAGTYVSGTALGGLIGRVLAGPLAELVDWRFAATIVMLLSACAALVFIVTVPASRAHETIARASRLPLRKAVAANLRDSAMIVLFAQALLLMGGFVAIYNYLAFRLEAAPFNLSPAVSSLLFFAFLAGTISSRIAGNWAARAGRRRVLIGSTVLMIAGVLLTVTPWIPVILVGLVALTGGFFGAHAIASGWVGARATVGTAQAVSLYNIAYYVGSGLFGWLGGIAYAQAGWGGTAGMVVALAIVAVVLASIKLKDSQHVVKN